MDLRHKSHHRMNDELEPGDLVLAGANPFPLCRRLTDRGNASKHANPQQGSAGMHAHSGFVNPGSAGSTLRCSRVETPSTWWRDSRCTRALHVAHRGVM